MPTQPTLAEPVNLVAYLRVSSETQLDGYGLDVQRDAVTRWCAANGHTLLAEYRDEGVSGTLPATQRPGLTAALADPDADGLVVARLDRLARALTVQEAILATLWRDDWTVIAVDTGVILRDDPDDPMRTAMRQMAGVFAELDRAMVVKRLRDGRRAKAAAGGHPSGRYPFGHTKHGPDGREQNVLLLIAALRDSGRTWPAIAAELNSRGPEWRPRTASRWTAATVRRLL